MIIDEKFNQCLMSGAGVGCTLVISGSTDKLRLCVCRSRKRRGSETLSEEEERSSGDEAGRGAGQGAGQARRGRRSHGLLRRKESRRRGEECHDIKQHTSSIFPKMFFTGGVGRSGSPIMTECTAAMVLMDLSGSPASRLSHVSGQSGRDQYSDKLPHYNMAGSNQYCG